MEVNGSRNETNDWVPESRKSNDEEGSDKSDAKGSQVKEEVRWLVTQRIGGHDWKTRLTVGKGQVQAIYLSVGVSGSKWDFCDDDHFRCELKNHIFEAREAKLVKG